MHKDELEGLARAIFEEVARVYHEQVKDQAGFVLMEWDRLTESMKTAYISGARAANTLVINALIRHGQEKE